MENNNTRNESFAARPQSEKSLGAQRPNFSPASENGASLRSRIKTTAFDKIAMLLNFVLTFLFIRSLLFAERSSWRVTASYLGIFALATVFVAVRQKIFNVQAALSGALCVGLSLSFALRENPVEIQLWAVVALMYLSGSYCLALTNANRHGRGSYFFLLDVLKTEVLLPFKHFFLPYAAMLNTSKSKKREKTKPQKKLEKKYLAAIIGVACAVPVLLIVVPLLLKSDAAFESVAGSFFEKLGDFFKDFDKSFGRIGRWTEENLFFLIPAFFVAPYIFSVMFSFRHSVSNEENKNTLSKYAEFRFGSPALFSGFLGVICLVYVIYLLSQATYFFSAFGGKLPGGTDISLAQYARRGFFELASVAGVNLALIAVTVLFSRRENGDFNVVVKVFDLFLCAFNILLSAISMSKIVLYMNEMGLTHKRIYVFLADIVMIVTFLCVIIRLLNRKFPYMRVITATACVLLTALSLVGADGLVAKYNTEKYLNGELFGETVADIFDSSTIATYGSCLKIAESDTKLKLDALVEAHDRNFVFSDGEVKLGEDNGDYLLNIDARNALKDANEHIDTVAKAFEDYDVKFDENGFFDEAVSFKIYITDNTSLSTKSISLTLYNENEDECETSVLQNANGSELEKDEAFGFEFVSKNVVVGDYHTLEISVTDFDGQSHTGEFTAEYFSSGTHIDLVSSGENVLAVCDAFGVVTKLEK